MEQVKILLDLQEIMTRVRAIEEEKRKVPLEVADLKGLFDEREAASLAAGQEFETVRNQRRELEREIEEERDKVEKAKAKLMGIKTNKEYYAMLKEIEQTKRLNTEREESLLALMTRYEETEKRAADCKAELDEVDGKYRTRMVDVDARIAAFDQEIARIASEKQRVGASIDKGLLRRFELIFERREGLAIAAARNCSCSGCHMNLSPQLYNMLQREDKLYACPNCNRLLYYAEEQDGAEAG
jgi:predicted  nucleic acid-binding Zn-ribbon protein